MLKCVGVRAVNLTQERVLFKSCALHFFLCRRWHWNVPAPSPPSSAPCSHYLWLFESSPRWLTSTGNQLGIYSYFFFYPMSIFGINLTFKQRWPLGQAGSVKTLLQTHYFIFSSPTFYGLILPETQLNRRAPMSPKDLRLLQIKAII